MEIDMEDRKIVFKCRSGSHLYGLNTPQSDVDFMSVIMPLPKDLLGLQQLEEIDNSTKSSSENRRNTADDIDDHQYTLLRYVHLIMHANPEKTESLFAEPKNIELIEPEVQFLIKNRDKLISKRVLHSFSGFAYSQKSKLIVKKERFGSLCETVDFMEKNFSVDRLTTNSNDLTEEEAVVLNKMLKHYKGSKNNCESFHKGLSPKMIHEKLVSERDNYGWRVKTDSFSSLGYDVKFAYHLIRLLDECRQLLETGEINYPFEGKTYEDIMSIRNAQVSYEQLMKMYEEYEAKIEPLKEKNCLRDKPDFNFINDWLVETILKHFKTF